MYVFVLKLPTASFEIPERGPFGWGLIYSLIPSGYTACGFICLEYNFRLQLIYLIAQVTISILCFDFGVKDIKFIWKSAYFISLNIIG
jgi:hypothetical protein